MPTLKSSIESLHGWVLDKWPDLFGPTTPRGGVSERSIIYDAGATEAWAVANENPEHLEFGANSYDHDGFTGGSVAAAITLDSRIPGNDPSCHLSIDASAMRLRDAERMHSAIEHEIGHCGLSEVLAPEQYDRLLEHVAREVPLSHMETQWWPAPAQMLGDNQQDVSAGVYGADMAGRYASRFGVDVDALTRVNPATGERHLGLDAAGTTGARLESPAKLWLEEAMVRIGTTPERTPEAGPRGAEAVASYFEGVSSDIGEMGAGKLSQHDLETRHEAFFNSIALAAGLEPSAGGALKGGPEFRQQVGKILGDMSAVGNNQLSEEAFAARHPEVIAAAESGAVRAFCPEGAQGEAGRIPRGGAEVGCYLRDMMSDIDEVYAGRMTKPEFDARHRHVVGDDPRAASLNEPGQARAEGTTTQAPLFDRQVKAGAHTSAEQTEKRLTGVRAEREQLVGRRNALDSPRTSAGRAGRTTQRESLRNNVARGRGQATIVAQADKAQAPQNVAQGTARGENSGHSASRDLER